MADRAQRHRLQFVPVVCQSSILCRGETSCTMRYMFDVSSSPNSATSISVSVSFAAARRGVTSGSNMGGR